MRKKFNKLLVVPISLTDQMRPGEEKNKIRFEKLYPAISKKLSKYSKLNKTSKRRYIFSPYYDWPGDAIQYPRGHPNRRYRQVDTNTYKLSNFHCERCVEGGKKNFDPLDYKLFSFTTRDEGVYMEYGNKTEFCCCSVCGIDFDYDYGLSYQEMFRYVDWFLDMKDFNPTDPKTAWKLQIIFHSAIRAKLGIIIETPFYHYGGGTHTEVSFSNVYSEQESIIYTIQYSLLLTLIDKIKKVLSDNSSL